MDCWALFETNDLRARLREPEADGGTGHACPDYDDVRLVKVRHE
jgi:hypothetical protein